MTKYISRDELIEFIRHNSKLFLDDYAQAVFGELMALKLPTIDPISTIDEMIEDLLGKGGSIPEIAKNTHQMEVLQALKSRLSLIK